jgi:hypothetical protein
MSFAHRYIRGFQDSERKEVERIVQSCGFNVFPLLRISGELEVSIAYDPSFPAKCNALEKTLQEKVNSSIQMV